MADPHEKRAPCLRLLGAALAALALLPSGAAAAVIKPTTTADGDGVAGCTLRESVIAANTDTAYGGCTAGTGNDIVSLSSGIYALTRAPVDTTLDRSRGSLDVYDPTAGANELTIAALTRNATIDAGGVPGGDRVLSTASPLTLTNVTVTGGDANDTRAVPGVGGGVLVLASGRLTVNGSLIAGNSATLRGGGIHSVGPLTIVRSTVSGNSTSSAAGGGGGGVSAAGPADISRTTIASNSADSGDDQAAGGGLLFDGSLALQSSILGDNSSDGTGADCGGAGSATSGGFNVVEVPCAQLATGASDRTGSDPALAGLAANGGPTRTQAIGAASPALDIGPTGAACAGTDQRGLTRGVPETGPCDAGAYERAICGDSPLNTIGTLKGDTIVPLTAPAFVFGQAGDDTINGTGGADALCGNADDDRLIGRAGSDRLIGGAGIDIADYSTAQAALTVTLDHVANDGVSGEGDDADVESILGARFADHLTGDGVANGILGAAGPDTLNGGSGNDSLRGGDGGDSLSGSIGNDVLDGGADADTILGQDGSEYINGGPGDDTLNGGTGDDTIRGGAGKDRFTCGAGSDTVHADGADIVAGDCETVIR